MPIELLGRDQIAVSYGQDDEGPVWVRQRSRDLRSRAAQWAAEWGRHAREAVEARTLLRVGVVHWVMLAVWAVLLLKMASVYERWYARSALFTTICTNALLFGTSDILAQCVLQYTWAPVDPTPVPLDTTARALASRYALFTDQEPDADGASIFNEYGPRGSSPDAASSGVLEQQLGYSNSASSAPLAQPLRAPSFDFYRWVCFMAWGSFLSFFQVPWYRILNYLYTEDPTVVQVLERVLSDQLVYSPISLYCFFMYASYIMEKGDAASFRTKIQRLYIGTLGCNYLLWPAVQFINFLAVPKHLQVPFSSSVGVLWNCFLSMRNASHPAK
ncbi:LAQU0S01e03796g1_1 [Lachancea quebecensis]|uniref:LAQU0S01e03796g1_1 n=1 Tax=Lachancea quebecensis TaxID=1654605 RepID=A0A0P1KLN8_9SACH|nr:LAQU0S01e03796g1_1 [Lachancea quebecensis]